MRKIKLSLALTGIFMAATSFAVCDTSKIVEIEIKDMKFVPEHVEICAGQTVRWTNKESLVGAPINHTVTADLARAQIPDNVLLPEGVEPFHSKAIKPGLSWEKAFTVLGDYKYFFVPHELMGHTGSLTVVESVEL